MGLYNKYLDFPKRVNQTAFLMSVAFLYAVFCIDPDNTFGDKSFRFKLFYNDFSEPGYASWFASSVYLYIFLIIITRTATALINVKLVKCIFYALWVDAILSLLHTVFFGYYNIITATVVRNIFTILAMFYAYFILPHEPRSN